MTDDTTEEPPRAIEERDVHPDDLHVDGDNPNEQSDELFGELIEGIRQKGWIGPRIVANMGDLPGYDGDPEGLICDGEHRLRAAREIGMEEVPVKFVDFEDDAERRLWRQKFNKLSGEHDAKRDALDYDYILDNGRSEELTDFVQAIGEDLDDLLAEIRVDTSTRPDYEYDPEHNVYFEDCVEGMRERLDDNSVDCVLTDPPYGVDVDVSGGMNRTKEAQHKGTVENDGLEEALDTFRDTLSEIDRVLSDDGLLYVFASWKTFSDFEEILESRGFTIFNCLVWVKTDTTPFTGYQGKYQYQHEFCLFAGREDTARRLNETPSDVMEYTEARFADVNDQITTHPTQKPVDLISDFIRQSSSEGDTILDPFMGSGTTAVAALQNDRDYIGFELDEENYRSVIERRIGEAKRAKNSSVNNDSETNTDTANADD